MRDATKPQAVSRLRRFAHSLGSAYGVLAATALFTLASVPLALGHLGGAEFGLWALMAQIGGYLALVDLGMSSSVARLLIDHKDRPNDGPYGSLIRLSWLVSCAQGVVVLAAGPLLGPLAAEALAIEPALREDFVALLQWQCLVVGAAFVCKPLHHLLYAHQRTDLTNYAQIAGWGVNYAVLWWAFAAGWGVYSLAWGGAAAWLVNQAVALAAVLRLRLLPRGAGWGRLEGGRFREVFAYAKDIFLIVLGQQLIDASQVLVVTRALGLEAAALWAVGTKTYQLVYQVNLKLLGASAPAFSEMITRGEWQRLRDRFQGLGLFCVALCSVGGAGFIVCNSAFVEVWTDGRLRWPAGYDVWLAAGLVSHGLRDYHSSLAIMMKDTGGLKLAYLAEGVIFLGLGLALTPDGGMGALLGLVAGCRLAITVAYGTRRVVFHLRTTVAELWGGWLGDVGRLWLRLGVLCGAAHALLAGQGAGVRFGTGTLLVLALGGVWLLRHGLTKPFQAELGRRLPPGFTRLLCVVSPGFGGG